MNVGAMMPHDSRSLPAISQRHASTLPVLNGSRGVLDRGSASGFVGAVTRFTSRDFSYGRDSVGKSSSSSDSRVSDYSDQTPAQGVSQSYAGGELSHQYNHKAQFNAGGSEQSQLMTHNFLPRLVDDQGLLRPSNSGKGRAAFSSRSLEILPSRDLISEELRMRTISLPSLRSRRKHECRARVALSDREEDSYTTEDSSEAESPIVEIDPFPNVGGDSYPSNWLLPDFLPPHLKPWTPGVRKTKPKRSHRNAEAEKKRKEMEALAAKEHKRKAQSKSRHPRRRSVRKDAFARKSESEVAKRYPVRKQFVYSELVQVELEKLTPKRLPGGKLKPIYNRRTPEGDIDIPRELHISLDSLSLRPGDERIDFSDSPAAINKRRKQELQALLERRKKIQRQMVHKKKRKVHFLLPEEEKRKHEVREQVNAVDSFNNKPRSRSTSPGQSSNSGVEEVAKEGDDQMDDGQANSPGQSGNRNPGDVITDAIYIEQREYRKDRTSNWVANHITQNLPQTLDNQASKNDNNSIHANQNSLAPDPEKVSEPSQSQSNYAANSSSTLPPDPYISRESAYDSDVNSNRQMKGTPPSNNRSTSAGKRKLLSVDDNVAQAAQLNPLPGIQPDSPLSRDDGVFVDTQPSADSGTVREIKFLSERLPSIIISDT
ncbi:uncharacterized protein LOC110982332 [Acanthaster planci]|uniref:Uncharacterized protein LOC110982332 n=1 Tax=Acanthaster planci TaxID=133434 RepID=A0A8B7YSU4_ACAPL|nr:uncharacterized protein LOC110982332 [Acanthaster planci]